MPRIDYDNLPRATVTAGDQVVSAAMDCCSSRKDVTIDHGVRFAFEVLTTFMVDHKCQAAGG